MKSTIEHLTLSVNRWSGWARALAPYVRSTVTGARPRRNAARRRATLCAGIDDDLRLAINGHEQWLRIRGESASNPVLLYLHGGPGSSQLPSYREYQLGWEGELTIVHWEQRGAGRSYRRRLDTRTLNLTQLVDDTLAVIAYLEQRFAGCPLVLLGHSWGSLLGMHVLRRNPKAVRAYVGVGQVANQVAAEARMYRFALEAAHNAGHPRGHRAARTAGRLPDDTLRSHRRCARTLLGAALWFSRELVGR